MSHPDCGGRRSWNGTGAPPAIAQAQNNLTVSLSQAIDAVGDWFSYIFKSDSVILGRNLEQSGYERWDNQHAHHIVASGAAAADPARQVLARVGMDINSAFNGAFLDAAYHQGLHTTAYYQNVNGMLTGAANYSDVAARLSAIRLMLETKTFPH